MTQPWNGHPLMNADRDGWHLLRFDGEKDPRLMWWELGRSCWHRMNDDLHPIAAKHAGRAGLTYVAGMVTPEEWEGRKNG